MSLTVLDTSTSPGRASPAIWAAMWTAMPRTLPFERSTSPVWTPAGTSTPSSRAEAAQRSLPPPIWIKAYPLAGLPDQPEVVAEFAAALLLIREGRRLRLAWNAPAFVDTLICPRFRGVALLESGGVDGV
jgi:hypothetical protein